MVQDPVIRTANKYSKLIIYKINNTSKTTKVFLVVLVAGIFFEAQIRAWYLFSVFQVPCPLPLFNNFINF